MSMAKHEKNLAAQTSPCKGGGFLFCWEGGAGFKLWGCGWSLVDDGDGYLFVVDRVIWWDKTFVVLSIFLVDITILTCRGGWADQVWKIIKTK